MEALGLGYLGFCFRVWGLSRDGRALAVCAWRVYGLRFKVLGLLGVMIC